MPRSTTSFTIILDLDSTLINTQDEIPMEVYEYYRELDVGDRLYTIDIHDNDGHYLTWGIKRPYLKEFLNFCFSYFKNVVVWTAGTYEYGHAIVNAVFPQKPHRIYTRDDCDLIRVGPHKGQLSKPISKFDFDPATTFTLDDKVFTAIENSENLINCPAYEPVSKGKTIRDFDSVIGKDKDRYLQKLQTYFLSPKVIASSDVRS